MTQVQIIWRPAQKGCFPRDKQLSQVGNGLGLYKENRHVNHKMAKKWSKVHGNEELLFLANLISPFPSPENGSWCSISHNVLKIGISPIWYMVNEIWYRVFAHGRINYANELRYVD